MPSPSQHPERPYPRWVFILLPILIGLHLNVWMWSDARMLLGVPVNLVYHLVMSAVYAGVATVLARRYWPRYLDEE